MQYDFMVNIPIHITVEDAVDGANAKAAAQSKLNQLVEVVEDLCRSSLSSRGLALEIAVEKVSVENGIPS